MHSTRNFVIRVNTNRASLGFAPPWAGQHHAQNPPTLLGIGFHFNCNIEGVTSSCFIIAEMKSQMLYFLNASCVGIRMPFQKHDSHIVYKMSVKNWNFHLTLLPLCLVLPGCHCLLLRLAWNNRKLSTQAWLLNGASRLDYLRRHSLAGPPCRAKLTLLTKRHLVHFIGAKLKPCGTVTKLVSRSVYAPI